MGCYSPTGQLEEQLSALQLRESPQERTGALRRSLSCHAADIYTGVFRATGDGTAIDVALGLYRAALTTFTLPDSPERLSTLNGLVFALRICFNRRRIPADLEEAISLSREAVALSSTSPSETNFRSLWNLGASLRMAHSNISGYSTPDYLCEAISMLRRAVAGESLGARCYSPNYMATIDLGTALTAWFLCSQDQEAILEAASIIHSVCEATDIEDADCVYGTVLLVNTIHVQITCVPASDISLVGGQVEDCLRLGRKVLALRGDWQYHLLLMQALAKLLRDRCQHHANISEADEAVSLLRRAMHLDRDYLCQRPMFLADLGLALRNRFHITGSSRDLDEALKHFRACRDVVFNNLQRALACRSLSEALIERFELCHASEDAEECIALAREARRLAPAQHTILQQSIGNILSFALIIRFNYDKHSCEDLEEAIAELRGRADPDPVEHWRVLVFLGWALRLHYEDISQDKAILVEARQCHMEALSTLHPGQWTGIGTTLCHLLQDSLATLAVCKEPRAHQEAMDIFRELMANKCLATTRRLDFVVTIVQRYARILPVTFALEIYQHILSLLPQVVYVGLEINAPAALSQATELVSMAAKCALSVGRVAEAVECIELGRAIFWSKALQLRMPCNSISGHIAKEFSQLSSMLLGGHFRVHSHSGLASVSEEDLSRHHMMADRYEELLLQIRSIPGHEDFLLPYSFQKLHSAMQGGFIVILSPADVGYNAIILDSTSETPLVIHLPNVVMERLVILSSHFNRELEWIRARDAEEYESLVVSEEAPANRLQMARRRIHGSTGETLFAELWRTTVYPVLEALKIPNLRGSRDRARLFWCPTGPYVSIPLHAAGIYTTANGPCAADFVIQSYIPTVSALIHAQRHEQVAADSEQSILLVAQPSAPGYTPLPNTVHEINVITNILGETQMLGVDDPCTATVQAVSRALSSASILHLACHGKLDKDALLSGFVMNDGTLTVAKLMHLDLPNAQFAFLSACHAAAINSDNPPDEVLHLASTMLYSGFRSVIATMWSMNDADGPTVAREVYTEAFKDGRLDLSRIPYALDLAVQKLKDDGVPASRWATYIHMGA